MGITQAERDRWTIIENVNNWLVKTPVLHPDTTAHQRYWETMYKYCIEGFWGHDFGKFRFMPPKLFYYINFYTLVSIKDLDSTVPEKIRPRLRDLEWELFYCFFVARGFSGFEEDDEYSCHEKLKEFKEGKITKTSLPLSCYNMKGELKKYMNPLDYVRKLHDNPMGKPLYENRLKNIMIFGSRSSGKTASISALCLHEMVMDGAIEYIPRETFKKGRKTGVCIGAAKSNKSSQFFSYMEGAMNEYFLAEEFGVWGEFGKEDYEPSPFARTMIGSIKPNNDKSLWRHEYVIKDEYGNQVTKGSLAFAKHVNYKDDTEAAASGRYRYNVIEEIGLLEDAPIAWKSNEFTTLIEGKKIGTLVGLGTSGDMEKVEGARSIFLNPFSYDCVAYKDIWEGSGEEGYTGFFIPAYLTDMKFKDKNGNTDLLAAKTYYYEQLEKLKDNPIGYRAQCMHAPLVISHMWINNSSNLLPVEEAERRERALLAGNLYQKLGRKVKLVRSSEAFNEIEVIDNPTAIAITDPYTHGKESLEDRKGCIVIYEPPVLNRSGEIYPDQYIIVHDPYAGLVTGESLQATYVIMNPKYIPDGFNGNTIVATYIGRPDSQDSYLDELEKLVQLYGNCPFMLWYEADRGNDVRRFFINKKKQNLLCIRPQIAVGKSMYQKNVTEHGYIVGNRVGKMNLVNGLSDWLLDKTNINGTTLMNIERIPCLYTVRQIKMFNLEDNFDGVDALCGLPLALKEMESNEIANAEKKNSKVKFLVKNLNKKTFKEQKQYLWNQT